MKQLLRDTWENVKHGFIAMWVALDPTIRTFFIGFGLGVLTGAVIVWLLC